MLFLKAGTSYEPGYLSKIKKNLLCWLIPNWLKSKSPPNGLQINFFTLGKAILLPLILVGFDVGSDAGVLGQMYTIWIELWKGEWTHEAALVIYTAISSVILLFSTGNLIFSNPWASLLVNARTSVFMETRESERKDMAVPIGDCQFRSKEN